MYWLDNELPPPNVYHAQREAELLAQQNQGQGQQGQGQGQGQGRRGGGPGGAGALDPTQVSQRVKDIEDYIKKSEAPKTAAQ